MSLRPLLVCALALLTACGDKDGDSAAACAAGCDGTVLTTCTDGTAAETDCADEGMICHDLGDESHCMMDGDMEM